MPNDHGMLQFRETVSRRARHGRACAKQCAPDRGSWQRYNVPASVGTRADATAKPRRGSCAHCSASLVATDGARTERFRNRTVEDV